MARQYVQARRSNDTIDGKRVLWSESWPVPEDFSTTEHKFLQELCSSGVLSPREAYATVRNLRN